MRLALTSSLLIGVILAVPFLDACKDRSPGNSNNNGCPPRPCDNDGLCDDAENCLWCADCSVQCDLHDGQRYEFIATSLYFPESRDEARIVGVDLDGDGTIDNQAEFGPLSPSESFNQILNESIQQGRLIVLVRILANDLMHDDTVGVQLLAGDHDPTHDATEDNLTGNGHALLHPEVDDTLHLCGVLDGGHLNSGPGTIVFPYPLIDPNTGQPVLLPLVAARLLLPNAFNENELSEVTVGGAITAETWQDILIPAMAAELSAQAAADPAGWAALFAQDNFDAACDSQVEGCEAVVNGEGECAPWDGPTDPNPLLTATEVRCNVLTEAAFHPDIDLDGDCLPDAMSLGFRMWAIRVTIDN